MTHVSIPILLVGIGVLIVVLALFVVARHLLVYRRPGTIECDLSRRGLVGGKAWQHGVVRFSTERIRWYRMASLHPGSSLSLRRSDIQDVQRRDLPVRVEGAPVECLVTLLLVDGREVQAIVEREATPVLTAWLEAAPTGQVIGDTD
ncbi:DUF2550 family protein [Brachybacterium sp. DNPG3]